MDQQLSLSARPRTLDGLVGQDKIVASIRSRMKDRWPKAFLFSGPTGSGKTTTARILALSYQCRHQNGVFGRPCKECYRQRSSFEIVKIRGAEIEGKKELQALMQGDEFAPFSGSPYRIYILDEAQRASKAAQSLLLERLEDTPPTSVYILCTTDPQDILETLRGRCVSYRMRELDMDAIELYVARLLKRLKSTLPADRLVEALVEKNVRLPRVICHAVEKYVGGSAPEEAAIVDVVEEVDTKALTRAMIKGDWPGVSRYLASEQGSDIRGIRRGVIAYLRVILLDSPEISDLTKGTARALERITGLSPNTDDLTLSAAIAAQLYQMAEIFAKYPR